MYVCRRGCVYDFTKFSFVDVFVIVLEAVFTSVLCVCGRGCVYIVLEVLSTSVVVFMSVIEAVFMCL